MITRIRSYARQLRTCLGLGAVAVLLGACSVAPPGQSVYDPQENINRKAHQFNKSFDKNLVQPLSVGYGTVVPVRVDGMISNFAENVSVPGEILNHILQFDAQNAVDNTIRLTVNTIFGIGGLFDVASELGMRDIETDFGETLHFHGFPEGPYVEIPVFGASTERDAWGLFGDFLLDPLNYVLPPGTSKVTVPSYVIDKLGDRYQYAEVIDGILYESEDSYVAQRTIYLQNRRFKLSGRDGAELDLDDLEDPYALD